MLAEAQKLLDNSRLERSAATTYRLLQNALRICDDEINNENPNAFLLKAQILAELAIEEKIPHQRGVQWKAALKSVNKVCTPADAPAIELYAALAVDCLQDRYSDLAIKDRLDYLRNAATKLAEGIPLAGEADTALLFARRSSVLRHLAIFDVTLSARTNRLQESRRCAERGYNIVQNESTALEFGLCEWALARHEQSDETFVRRLRAAETLLSSEQALSVEVGRLSLARFYRGNFRSLDACNIYSNLLSNVVQTRRVLRDAYIYSEAAMQLWYTDHPDALKAKHLKDAKVLLEEAVFSGYRNARIVIDLAFIVAIVDGVTEADLVLREICDDMPEIDWSAALKVAAKSDDLDHVTSGFVMGMDDSAVWTRLGTFALSFRNDNAFAEMLYRKAVKMDAHDAIALTNLGRFLSNKEDEGSWNEAERLIQRARSAADRRFMWWRPVQQALALKRGRRSKEHRAGAPLSLPPSPISELSQIRGRFLAIEALPPGQARGYELEALVYDLCRLTFGTAAPAYRAIREKSGVIRQIDGYFEHAGEKYRVECKWKSELTSQTDVTIFANRLDAAGISGLLISMSGFESSAIAQARELRKERAILLMDGNEIAAAFNYLLRFDEIISVKRTQFDQRSNPYFVVTSKDVAA